MLDARDSLPPQIAEPLIFKLALTSPQHTSLLVKNFNQEWFEDKKLGKILAASVNYYKAKNQLPSKEVVKLIAAKAYPEQVTETQNMVESIYSTVKVAPEDQTFIDEQVISYLRLAGSFNVLFGAIDKIEKKDKNLGKVIDKWQDILNLTYDADLGFDYYSQMEQHCKALLNPDAKLTFGINELDKITHGGMLRDGRFLGLFLAATGVGKSVILSNICSKIQKRDKFVVIISLEMSEYVYGQRIDALMANVDINQLNAHTESLQEMANRMMSENPKSKIVIKEYPPESINAGHIRTYLDRLISREGRNPDLVIVDYMSLMLPLNKQSNEEGSYWRGGSIAREVRALSYHFKCPFLSAAQLNRGGYGNAEPALEQISESTGPLMVADFICGLFFREGDREIGQMQGIVLKNRLGGKVGHVFSLGIDWNTLALHDIDQIDDNDKVMNIQSEFQTTIDAISKLEEKGDSQ